MAEAEAEAGGLSAGRVPAGARTGLRAIQAKL